MGKPGEAHHPVGPQRLVRAAEEEGVRDRRVLDAFGSVRRDMFVPADLSGQAYDDRPIPIPHGQVTTQPSLVARMVVALRLVGTERVLEIGTGLGYQTAVLARLAGEVFSVERFTDLAAFARRNLRLARIANVTVVVGDGSYGLPTHAPYDGVIVSAASPSVPPPLAEQLAEGGRLVHPIGPGGSEIVVSFRKRRGRLVEEERLVHAFFVRLIGEHGLRG
jgi:protein-L-isoaspartate(D-aspartate) O-methyltransferase